MLLSLKMAFNASMKALILLGTLKRKGLSNTETLAEYVAEEMKKKDIDVEIVKLVDHVIAPGTYTDMGAGDHWPVIYEKVIGADILIFATPIWWDNHSSETQRVIERLDEIHDEILDGKTSKLEGKLGGVIITGDSDGAQHITGSIFNFLNGLGVAIPPFAAITDLSAKNGKTEEPTRADLVQRFKKDHSKEIATMIEQMLTLKR
ncbi:MAG: flavodoxin [Candidatus Kaiserbacteria bacterium]|nr:flavodoxin [Candidatus Kaiserbacteria bacterium]